MDANIVAAIADQHQSFLVAMPHVQLPQTIEYRVVKRRPASRKSAIQGGTELLDIAREKLAVRETAAHLLVEIQHECFILRIALGDKCTRGCQNVCALVTHTLTFIYQDSHGYRKILAGEDGNRLKNIVLKHAEIVLREPWHEGAAAILHTD